MARSHRTTNKRSIKHCVLLKSGRRRQDVRNFRFYIHLILEQSPWEANTVTQLDQKLNTFSSIWCSLDHAPLWQLKNKKPTRCHLLFYCTCYRLNMFQALLCPSSGARDYDVDYHSHAWASNPDTTPTELHLTSNIQQTKNETTNVVINIIVESSWWWTQ